jgi:hypothetical protein
LFDEKKKKFIIYSLHYSPFFSPPYCWHPHSYLLQTDIPPKFTAQRRLATSAQPPNSHCITHPAEQAHRYLTVQSVDPQVKIRASGPALRTSPLSDLSMSCLSCC